MDHLYGIQDGDEPDSGKEKDISDEKKDAMMMQAYFKNRLGDRKTVYFPGTKYRLWGETKIIRNAEDDQTGVPVSALLVPIKNIAGPTSDFLRVLIKAAEKSDDFAVFENEVVKVRESEEQATK